MKLDTIKSLRTMAGLPAVDEEAYAKEQAVLAEAALDARFSTQMDRVQGAINNLRVIVNAMLEPQSSSKPVAWQKAALEMASKDLKEIHDKL